MTPQAPVALIRSGRVAELLGVNRATASRWGKEGRLLTWPGIGTIRRFFAAEVEALRAGKSPAEARRLAEAERDRLAGRPRAEGYARVYSPAGKMSHLIPPGQDASGPALCQRQAPPGGWRGTRSQGECKRAAGMPLCPRCEFVAAQASGGER